MPRQVLEESRLHPAIREKVATLHADIVHNVQAAAASNPVLVVGMAQNPFCRAARKSLAAAEVPHQYLEYGSYFSQWRPRLALKLWSGWSTFPMIFVRGMLIGGADDLARLDLGALKMWTGWPTFPMVFVKGTLVGGQTDVQRLIDSGELKRLLGE